jgi:Domain of unknown function (DUF1735)
LVSKKKNMKQTKKINKITGIAVILMLLFTFSSCLKNGPYNIDFSTVGASVDLPLAASNSNGVVAFSYNATVTSTDIPVYINLASPSTLSKAVTATFALDTAYLNSYNTNNNTSYTVLPDSVYTIANGWNRNIPAGQRLDSMYIHFDFTKLDLTQNYILPITIQTATVAIEQWNHLMLYVSVKNQWDGHYTVTGTFTDVNNAGFTNNYPMDIDLITSGPNSVDVYNTQLEAVGYVFLNGGSATYYGSFGIRMFIDNNNNVTSVVNTFGQPASNTRSAQLDPSGINKVDASGNIDVKYFMIQPSAVPAPPSIRAYFNEHYAYLGPR